jgi:hypothetical protein
MSVPLTEGAVRERRKTVTRRVGWHHARAGMRLTLCRKVLGRKPNEPLVRLADVEIVSVRRERLDAITEEDVAREGFDGHSPAWFVAFFKAEMGVEADTAVTRIEWRYLESEG